MKKLVAAALLASVAILGTTAADARDGCGRGGFRGPHGRCHYAGDRRGPVVVAPGGLVIGQRYDRGYWDGHRYWQNRYRRGNGWGYR